MTHKQGETKPREIKIDIIHIFPYTVISYTERFVFYDL